MRRCHATNCKTYVTHHALSNHSVRRMHPHKTHRVAVTSTMRLSCGSPPSTTCNLHSSLLFMRSHLVMTRSIFYCAEGQALSPYDNLHCTGSDCSVNPLQSRDGLGLVNSPSLQSSALSMSKQILQNHKRPAEQNDVTDSEDQFELQR